MKKIYHVKLRETVEYFGAIEADSIEDALVQGKLLAQDNAFPNGEQELVESTVTAQDDDGGEISATWQ